ncbi:MAG: TIM barrel protein [Chloroflexaceae bacterium]|jgi:hydroxypyruvate isomerase|nr:TIM barrel protein [Chloroflexaceae bacterium]
MLRFDLNISITMKETPFLERFDAAARLGFNAVEFWWPTNEDLPALVRQVRAADLAVALFNFDAGNLAAGERGFLNDPSYQTTFRNHVPAALELAHQLGCRRINALAGKWLPNEARASQLERVRENLRWAAELAADAGITIVVESLNAWENSGYLFTDTAYTLAFLNTIDMPNVAYQYDVYHMQRMEGNVTETIRNHSARMGHIQIADSPGRNQPGTGELNFPFIFEAIEASGYNGYVGLEYNPRGPLAESLAWMPK